MKELKSHDYRVTILKGKRASIPTEGTVAEFLGGACGDYPCEPCNAPSVGCLYNTPGTVQAKLGHDYFIIFLRSSDHFPSMDWR